MKQLTCEVCGGNDLLKQDGVFVCQSCGCKYSAEEVKKLMVQISEPIKVDGIENFDQILENANTFFELEQIDNANKLFVQLTEKYPSRYEGWWGVVITRIPNFFGEQTTSYNYLECDAYIAKCYNTAKKFCPLSELPNIESKIKAYLESVQRRKNFEDKQKQIDEQEILEKNNQLYNYLYNKPGCYEFDYYHNNGCFPIFVYVYNGKRYITNDGQRYINEYHAPAEQLSETVKKFIDECNRNMKIYCETFGNKLNTEQWYLLRDKMVLYLCGKGVLTDIKNKFNDKGFYVGKPGQIRPNLGTTWAIAGINGYTLSIKPFYSDAYDNKCITYPTKIQIMGNIKEIITNAEKENIKINKIKSNEGCYIATSVYGSYDCPEVWTLRRYRDYNLAKTCYGRAFIKTYYTISPTLVKLFGNTSWFQNFWKNKLDRMVCNLKNKGFEDKPYDDRKW